MRSDLVVSLWMVLVSWNAFAAEKAGWLTIESGRDRPHSSKVRVKVVRAEDGSYRCGTDQVPMHGVQGEFVFERPFESSKVRRGCKATLSWEGPGARKKIETCRAGGGTDELDRFIQRCLLI